jgi:uncharacterized protein YpmS
MMTTMLCLTILTLIAIFFVLKRLHPQTKQTPLNDIKDTHNNTHNHTSLLKDDIEEPISTSASSKNCYIALVQQDDEQNDYLLNENSLTKCSSNNKNHSNGDIQNQSLRYDTSSTNVLCLSDEHNRTLANEIST